MVRGSGLMNALVFNSPGLGVTVMNHLRCKGVIALVSGTQGESLSLTPALNIPKDDLWTAVDAVVEVVKVSL
jgi:acetylornithine/succinyldiaminopimelate/putrescine aminotransferase